MIFNGSHLPGNDSEQTQLLHSNFLITKYQDWVYIDVNRVREIPIFQIFIEVIKLDEEASCLWEEYSEFQVHRKFTIVCLNRLQVLILKLRAMI